MRKVKYRDFKGLKILQEDIQSLLGSENGKQLDRKTGHGNFGKAISRSI